MIELILLIGLIYWAGTSIGDWAGVLGMGLLAVLVIGLLIHVAGKQNRAYGHWVDYWAEGGPDRKRR